MFRNGRSTAQVLGLAFSVLLAAGCSRTAPPLPRGAPLADYHPPRTPLPDDTPGRAEPGPPPAAVVTTLHRLADAAAAYAERHAVPGAPDVTLAELVDQGYLDDRFVAGYADREGYRFSGTVGPWGFTLAARNLGPEAGLDCFIDPDRIVCTDPACTRPLAEAVESRRATRWTGADAPAPPLARPTPPHGGRTDRERLLGALAEMRDFLSSPRLEACLVEGSLDSRLLKERLDAIILKHFRSFPESDDASRRWKDDPDVGRAGGGLVDALRTAIRNHGIRITGP
ncbi:MAG: hypothetical protein KA419_08495 [Acidobacteria bacterium]|nr:hypothetical protein [Acidobacteriota bacterium]